jgi:predicted outer membrane protein
MKMSAIVVAGLLSLPFSGASAQVVNDAQIASIVVTANQVDIDAGRLAKSRSTNDEVRAFAELMISDHTSVNKSATDLVAKLKVTPQDNPTSQSLKVNKDLVPHTATSTAGTFDSKNIQADRSWKLTTRKTGDFAYICTFHPTMKAMLRVK